MSLTELYARALVVLKALPSRLAALAAVLVVVDLEVVPLLPAPLAVKVGAAIASALAFITGAVKVIARLTQVPPEAVGLVVPDGKQMRVELVAAPWPAGHGPDNPPSRGLHTGGIVRNPLG